METKVTDFSLSLFYEITVQCQDCCENSGIFVDLWLRTPVLDMVCMFLE